MNFYFMDTSKIPLYGNIAVCGKIAVYGNIAVYGKSAVYRKIALSVFKIDYTLRYLDYICSVSSPLRRYRV